MMQMYKVFYKANEIVFNNVQTNSAINANTHTLINPQNRQLMAALNTCFVEKSDISRLHILCNDPQETFNEFIKELFLIEAAGGIITNERQEWLLIKRIGVWDLPKGKIDSGESKEIAAIREVKEETGIKSVSIVKELSPSFHIYPIDDEWVFKITHWFLMLGTKDKLTPQKEEKISEAVWMNEISVKKFLPFMYPSLLHVFEEAGLLLKAKE
jgi:8-oxo-dGTP pyrophosphatase MutT (NUDIX family)